VLDRLARVDELTGLANRRQLLEQLSMSLNSGHRRSSQVSVLLIDIDHVKQVNDTFGHDVGDRGIQHVATLYEAKATGRDTIRPQP
jgi:diguanylate cyclase (GGDEF)-like protein